MIDFDNPNTFPKELRNWGIEFEKMILRRVNADNIKEWWQICYSPNKVEGLDLALLQTSAECLPNDINESTWSEWTKLISTGNGATQFQYETLIH